MWSHDFVVSDNFPPFSPFGTNLALYLFQHSVLRASPAVSGRPRKIGRSLRERTHRLPQHIEILFPNLAAFPPP